MKKAKLYFWILRKTQRNFFFYFFKIPKFGRWRTYTYIDSLKMEILFAINAQGLAVNLECNWSSVNICWMSGWMNEWVKSIRVLSLEALCNLFFSPWVIPSQILFSYDQVSSIILITLLSGWLGVFVSILCWWHHQLALLRFVRCLPVHCSLMETSEMKVDLGPQTKGTKIKLCFVNLEEKILLFLVLWGCHVFLTWDLCLWSWNVVWSLQTRSGNWN